MSPSVMYIQDPNLNFFQIITSWGFLMIMICILIPTSIIIYLIMRFMIIGNTEYKRKKARKKEKKQIKKEIESIRNYKKDEDI